MAILWFFKKLLVLQRERTLSFFFEVKAGCVIACENLHTQIDLKYTGSSLKTCPVSTPVHD